MNSPIHVAVGVIGNADGQILIARRPAHLHQGELWEFPGGKVESNEDVTSALRRELHEELGIQVVHSKPLISLKHDYGDRKVWLDVHRVDDFDGEARGAEGQEVRWVRVAELVQYEFPAANRAILNAVRLPELYMITGDFADTSDCIKRIQRAIDNGVQLIQLRANHLSERDYLALACELTKLQDEDIHILLNTDPSLYAKTTAAGLHLNRHRLMQMKNRPVGWNKLLSASVHNQGEIVQAYKLAVDMVLLSPVMPTNSHSGEKTLGWQDFSVLVEKINCPVYALGGMSLSNITSAKHYGAQGIAGISMYENIDLLDKL